MTVLIVFDACIAKILCGDSTNQMIKALQGPVDGIGNLLIVYIAGHRPKAMYKRKTKKSKTFGSPRRVMLRKSGSRSTALK